MPKVNSEVWWDSIAEKWKDKGDKRQRPSEYSILANRITFGPVLEVGCGVGSFFPYVGAARNYMGLDISGKMILEARKSHPSGFFLKGDVLKLGTAQYTGAFEWVASLQTLEHFPQETFNALMEKFQKISRQGLLFSVPSVPAYKHQGHVLSWLSVDDIQKDFGRYGEVEMIELPEEIQHFAGVVKWQS